jgi:hypothetical protein
MAAWLVYNTGTVSDSFYDKNTTGQSDSSGGEGKSTAEMKTISTYVEANWDFSKWAVDSSHNEGYPLLREIQIYLNYNGNLNTGGEAPIDSSSYLPEVTASVYGDAVNLVKTGYSFGGWNKQADGLGASYAPAASLTLIAYTYYLNTAGTGKQYLPYFIHFH